jgi:hypothetical protein
MKSDREQFIKQPLEINYNDTGIFLISDLTNALGKAADILVPELRPNTPHETVIFHLSADSQNHQTILNITRIRRDRALISKPFFRVHARQISPEGQQINAWEEIAKITINDNSITLHSPPDQTHLSQPLATISLTGEISSPTQ